MTTTNFAHPVYDQTATIHRQEDLHPAEQNGAYSYYPGQIGQIYPYGGYYPGSYGHYPSEYNYYNYHHGAYNQPNPILNYNQRYF